MTNKKNYTKREKFFLLGFLLLSIAGFLCFWQFGDRAYQQFDIKFKITRDEATNKSTDFAKELGFSTDGYKKITVFNTESGLDYLEKEIGVEKTSKLAENDMVVWDFATRFVKPLQKEELTVNYLPNGRMVGFNHIIDENSAGDNIGLESAKTIASEFISSKTNITLSEWYLASSDSSKKPNRTDSTFTYEKIVPDAKDATARFTIGLSGKEVTSYSEFVKVPEAWIRDMTNESSKSFLSQTFFESLYFLLVIIPAIIIFFVKFRKTNFRYKFAIIVSSIFFGIYLLSSLNMISVSLFGYDTTQSWSSFIGGIVMISIVSVLIEAIILFFALIVGETLYREAFPKQIALEKIFTKAGLRTKTVNYLMISGVCLAFCMMAYEVIYYFFGSKIGFWSPAEINYSELYSTYAPWLYPLTIGFIAAVSEEVAFRMFGITFLKKYLKNTWVAIIISAMVWGFLHSSYAQIPWFIRGLELTIVGIGFGWIYVRYGLIPSIIAHFTYNAFITAMSYMSSGNPYIIASSIFVSLIPAIIALIIYIRSRTLGFPADPDDLVNENIRLENKIVNSTMQSNVAPSIFQPIARLYKVVLPVLAIVGLAVGTLIYLKINPGITPTTIDSNKAIEIATNIAKDEAISASEYQVVASYGSSTPVDNYYESNPPTDPEVASDAMQKDYLKEIGGWNANKDFYKKIPVNVWAVRFYKEMQKEEYIVDLLPDGTYYRLTRILDETAPGYAFTEEQASTVATDFIKHRKLMSNFKIIDQKSEKRDQRTDFKIIFEENDGKVGDAAFRTSVTIIGKNVAGFEQYYKIPNEWIRDKEKQTTVDFIELAVLSIFGLALVVLCVIAFIRALKNGQINFKRVLIIGIILIAFDLLAYLNGFGLTYVFYDTTMPFWRYFLMDFFFFTFGASLISSVVLAFAIEFAISLWDMIIFNAKTNKNHFKELYKEGLIVGFSLPLILLGLEQLTSLLGIKINQLTFVTDSAGLVNSSGPINTYLPFFDQITSSISMVGFACIISLIVLVVYLYTKRWQKTALVFAVLVLLVSVLGQKNITDILTAIGINLVLVGIFGVVIWKILRKNPISYIIAIWTSIAIPLAFQLLYQKAAYYQFNGWIVIVVTLLPIAIYLSNYVPAMKMKNLRKMFWK